MTHAALSVQGARKSYGTTLALAGVDLEVAPGEFFGLLGPNGAGKSTLMHLLSGYLRPDAGTVRVAGLDVAGPDGGWRHRLGLVPQGLALFDDLSARANLHAFGRLHGLTGPRLRARADAVLEAVGLTGRDRDAVKTYSGGMKRRLNLAVALLHEPSILLCDEPTVGVDPQSRNAIFEHLRTLHATGLTVVYTTHYMEEAERLCTRLAIIDAGRIVAGGTIDDLLGLLPFAEEIRLPRGTATGPLAGIGDVVDRPAGPVLRPPPHRPLSAVFADLEARGLDTRRVEVARPDLEGVFLHLTGRSLRD